MVRTHMLLKSSIENIYLKMENKFHQYQIQNSKTNNLFALKPFTKELLKIDPFQYVSEDLLFIFDNYFIMQLEYSDYHKSTDFPLQMDKSDQDSSTNFKPPQKDSLIKELYNIQENIINYPQDVQSEQGQFYILPNKLKSQLEYFELKLNYSSNRQELLKQLEKAINELRSKIKLEEIHSENPDGLKNQKQEIEKQKTQKQAFVLHKNQLNRKPTNNKNEKIRNKSTSQQLKQNPNNQQTNPKQNQLAPADTILVEKKFTPIELNGQSRETGSHNNIQTLLPIPQKQSNFSKQFQFRKNFNKDQHNKLKSGQGQWKQRKQIMTNVHNFFKKKLPNQQDPVNISDRINAEGRSIVKLKQYFGQSKTDQDYIELRRRARNFLTSSTYIQQIFTSEQKIDKVMMIKYSNRLQMFPLKPQEWKWKDQ